MSEPSVEFVRPDPEFVHLDELPDAEALRASAAADPVGFWEAEARELEWYQPWEKVLDDSGAPFFKWFTGAKTNIVHNAIDRHVHGPYKNKLALIWVGENGTDHQTYSYFSLNREVTKMANIIKAMGVTKGDKVTIYLPRIPEIVFAMLACAKIGAIHSVVFAGFSADALSARIDDSESKLVITADGSWVNGGIFKLKDIVDEAIRFSPSVENVIVVRRTGHDVAMEPLRDHWYHELGALPIANGSCPTEPMDAEDPLYILYTSGSTGAPKAILHTHGGYMVGTYATLKYTFDIRDEDR
ncbi:MAG: AMP-binding protein, partial [Propionibacteriaceae bacterium]|nr:AMP-binding protein [Propionibacteriaceae bacterium]